MSGRLNGSPETKIYEIEDLTAKVWAGEMRVPHFQRGFRWGHKDVSLLFESILYGYPVGSLLLWKRPAKAATVVLGGLEINAPEARDALWVVDGQQRITSLANALHPEAGADQRFALSYDLRNDRFVNRTDRQRPWLIPLPALFDYQLSFAWLAENPEAAEYSVKIPTVAKTIRQFKVPAYLVETDDVTALQDIFDRMNNYGKRLKRAEVFSALHAGAETDESPITLVSIASDIAERHGFGLIDDDTVLQALLARRGPDVIRDIHTEFDDENRRGTVDFRGEGRDAAYHNGAQALDRAVRFLQEDAGVPHLALLPYRYLLVVLSRFFAHFPEPAHRERQLLRRWFWRTVVVGHAKSSPASAVRDFGARIVADDLGGSVDRLFEAIEGRAPGLPDLHVFRANNAMTKVVLCSWWHSRPMSAPNGEPFDTKELSDLIGDRPTAVDALAFVVNPRSVSEEQRKWAATRVLLPYDEIGEDSAEMVFARASVTGGEPVSEADGEQWGDFLASHGVTPEAASLLAGNRIEEFVDARDARLHECLEIFLQSMCEWDFEDTPTIESLILDDEDDDDDAA